MTARLLPPRPAPSSSRLPKFPSIETDFWAGLFLDLSVRVEWLGQVLDAVPKEDASAAALVRLRSYAHAIQSSIRGSPPCRLTAPSLASRIYSRWTRRSRDISAASTRGAKRSATTSSRIAVALRRKEPTSMVFSHRTVNDSYAEFEALITSVRQATDAARNVRTSDSETVWRAFEEHVEELMWSTEWVHMTLARRPGE